MIRGLDLLRIFALLLITWQHAASALGFYAATQWRLISPGQAGVAIFCGVSGLLAFSSRPASPWQWFRRRLARIFPAYWLVTLVAFGLAFAWSAKKISVGLFVSQMLGVGYFTHGWELINVVSWFVSLIILCYALAAIAWQSDFPKTFLGVVALLAATLCALRYEVDLSRHLLSFALVALIPLGVSRSLLGLLGLALLAAGVFVDPQFFYCGLALSLILPVLRWPVDEPALVSKAGGYAYEYYLVHGIFLAGAVKLIANPLYAVSVALALSSITAIVLHRLSQPLIVRLGRPPEAFNATA